MFVRKESLIDGVGRHGFDMYVVTVIKRHDENFCVYRGGLMRELDTLVREDLTSDSNTRFIDCVGAYARW